MLNKIAADVHSANIKWWVDIESGKRKDRNIGELLMLAVSELSEAMEGHRKSKMDDHLPLRKMFDVEIVDCMIRLFDIAGAHEIDLDSIFSEKMEFNSKRSDHSIEARRLPDGKKY